MADPTIAGGGEMSETEWPGMGEARLDALRMRQADGPVAHHVDLGGGIDLRIDPETELSGHWRTEPGRILDLDLAVTRPGGWAGLHLRLDAADLGPARVLGYACTVQAPVPRIATVCLRSGRGDGFVDTFFEDAVLFAPMAADHHAVLWADRETALATPADWRELILFLPTDGGRLSIHDLRAFAA